MLIASWNIEKNGQSSVLEKQSKVSDFIDRCCNPTDGLGVDLLFLCEVHSARYDDYKQFLQQTYQQYSTTEFAGGNSNYYVVMRRVSDTLAYIGYAKLPELNRYLVVYAQAGCYVGFAHFKSGQLPLTARQIKASAKLLESKTTSNWLITGDMNWDYSKRSELALADKNDSTLIAPPGTKAYSVWPDATQKSGGILDWVLCGKNCTVAGMDISRWPAEFFDMQGPDHKPLIIRSPSDMDETEAI